MKKILLYAGESSFALREIGIPIRASEEQLGDDDIAFLIGEKNTLKIGNVYEIIDAEGLELIEKRTSL